MLETGVSTVQKYMGKNHVTHRNEPNCTRERVMSHIKMRHATNRSEYSKVIRGKESCQSCHTYERAQSHMGTSHVTHRNESCPTWDRVISHIKMSHVTRDEESCHMR